VRRLNGVGRPLSDTWSPLCEIVGVPSLEWVGALHRYGHVCRRDMRGSDPQVSVRQVLSWLTCAYSVLRENWQVHLDG